MREISGKLITDSVAELIQTALYSVEDSVCELIKNAKKTESSPLCKWAAEKILENNALAKQTRSPACQDCGQAVLFVSAGQEVHIKGDLRQALNDGVAQGYTAARKSVCDPLSRRNTGNNAPAIIHFDITEGSRLEIAFLAKGAGSENMSRLFMLNPTAGTDRIIAAVVEAVTKAGANPCPPIVLGIGIGGTADFSAQLAKKALLRNTGDPSQDQTVMELERRILTAVNKTGVGCMGFGGDTTCLAVHIETAPTHIGQLPVSVCLQCHCVRRGTVTL